MKRYLALWKKLIKIQLAHDMAYPSQFILFFIGVFAAGFAGPLFGFFVYGISKGFKGWTLNQYILLYGIYTLTLGLRHLLFARAPFRVIEEVKYGYFDKYLIRPIKTLPYILMHGLDFDGLGGTFAGIVLVIYSTSKIHLTFLNIIQFFYLIVLALTFMLSFSILAIGLSFLVVKSEVIMEVFGILLMASKYPISIYGGAIKFVITFLFPLGIISFYPAEALIKTLSFPFLISISFSILLFFLFSLFIFNWGLSKYQSAGG